MAVHQNLQRAPFALVGFRRLERLLAKPDCKSTVPTLRGLASLFENAANLPVVSLLILLKQNDSVLERKQHPEKPNVDELSEYRERNDSQCEEHRNHPGNRAVPLLGYQLFDAPHDVAAVERKEGQQIEKAPDE